MPIFLLVCVTNDAGIINLLKDLLCARSDPPRAFQDSKGATDQKEYTLKKLHLSMTRETVGVFFRETMRLT